MLNTISVNKMFWQHEKYKNEFSGGLAIELEIEKSSAKAAHINVKSNLWLLALHLSCDNM